MPCSRVSSDSVVLGLVIAVQSGFGVWGRLARSREIGVRWSLIWSWFLPDLSVNGDSTAATRVTDDTMILLGHRTTGDRAGYHD